MATLRLDGAAAVKRLALAAAGAMLTAGCLTMNEAAKQWLVDGKGALVPPKLHATLVNSKRRAPGTARKPIDARRFFLIAKYRARVPLTPPQFPIAEPSTLLFHHVGRILFHGGPLRPVQEDAPAKH